MLYKMRKEKIERVFADSKEKHAMRYTPYRGLTQVTNWAKLKFACLSNTDYRQYVTEIQELRAEIEEVDREIGLSMDENYIKMYHVEDDLYPNTQKIKQGIWRQ